MGAVPLFLKKTVSTNPTDFYDYFLIKYDILSCLHYLNDTEAFRNPGYVSR